MTQSIQARLQLQRSVRLSTIRIPRREYHPDTTKAVALRALLSIGTRPGNVLGSLSDEHLGSAGKLHDFRL